MKSYRQSGFVHIQSLLVALVVVIGIAAVGSYVISKSKAASVVPTLPSSISISPSSGLIGTKITINGSTTGFMGKYELFAQRGDSGVAIDLATLMTPNFGTSQSTSLTYTFPATLCPKNKNCAQVIEKPGKYYFWLAVLNNNGKVGASATSNKVLFNLQPTYTDYLTIDKTNVETTMGRDFPNYTLMQKDQIGYTEGLLYGPGFTITNKTAKGYTIKYNQPTQGVGFYESSGGLQTGQTVKIHCYINPNKPNGVYKGSVTLQYNAILPGATTTQLYDGPTINYTITLVDSNYKDYLEVSPLSLNVTLSRGNIKYPSYIFGPGYIFTAKENTTGFQFVRLSGNQDEGTYGYSGGLQKGQVYDTRSYISPNKPNGVYSGSYTLQYYNSKGLWLNGPTLTYSITLTD